jgi:hypothetical protein
MKDTRESGRRFPLSLAVHSVRSYMACDNFKEFNLEY